MKTRKVLLCSLTLLVLPLFTISNDDFGVISMKPKRAMERFAVLVEQEK